MRVGLVSPYSLSLPGGVQGQVLGLAKALRGLGHQVRVLGPCDGAPPEVGIIPLGNSIPTAANGSMAPVAPDPSNALRTIAALRNERFDVVHLHEPIAPGCTVTTLVCSAAPMVGTFHAAGTSAAYRWLAPLTCWLARRLTVRCAVSEDARDLAAGSLGGDYEILHNGIDVERFAKATPWPTEGPTVLFLSRHEARKGLDVLVDALPSLPAHARVWVASDGPDTARLKAATAGDARVEWLGRIDEDEKIRRLRGADVLCAPSLRGESFGMILLEAMAAETPIVASDLRGYRGVIGPGPGQGGVIGPGPGRGGVIGPGQGGVIGPGPGRGGVIGPGHGEQAALLVPPGDPAALGAALRRVLVEPDLAASLSAAGEARASEFAMDRLAARYVELYQTATARSRPV